MRGFLLSFVAIVLASCADGVWVSRQYIPQRGVPGHADYAAALGPTPVVLVNSPFPPAEVIAALGRNDPRPHQFTADPPPSLEGGYRLVLAFDADPARSQGCRTAPPGATPPAAPPARTSVHGLFCLGPALLSEAVATAPRIQSSGDPLFARLLGDLLSAMMPYRDPHEAIFDDS